MYTLLEKIALPDGIKNLSLQEKEELAKEVREKIIETVSKNGGHLAPSLGTVDLTIALLSEFDALKDQVVWDVGHQSYAWKILTGRYKNFHTLRKHKGISGFSNPSESPYDHFVAGHASVSISAALGKAYARDLNMSDSHTIAVIGDGALTGGMAYEALNHAGELKKQLIVILNDNQMSIAPNVGALSQFISSNLSKSWVLNIKKKIRDFCYEHPKFGKRMLNFFKRGEQSFKSFFTPGSLFEAFDFNYIGPVDGHNIAELSRYLQIAISAQKLNQPVLLHVKTIKGKGYKPAELHPSSFHAVSSFEPETGLLPPSDERNLYSTATQSFTQALCTLAKKDDKILAISAAMTEGTGLLQFSKLFPDRCIDVGICEQHAVTFAAGLASAGYKPIVAIYSTFIQRAYDQIIHDVCLQNLHVVFCLDRAGLVGEDGATHHGVFDLSFLRNIPNMRILVPASPYDFQSCLATALELKSPIALRYPRGKSRLPLISKEDYTLFKEGEGEFLFPEDCVLNEENICCEYSQSIGISKQCSYLRELQTDTCIICIGSAVNIALIATSLHYEEHKQIVPVFNARWVKPLPTKQLDDIATNFSRIIIVEENTEIGGFSSAILEYYTDSKQIQKLNIDRLALPDHFIEHGNTEILKKKYKLSPEYIRELLEKK